MKDAFEEQLVYITECVKFSLEYLYEVFADVFLET